MMKTRATGTPNATEGYNSGTENYVVTTKVISINGEGCSSSPNCLITVVQSIELPDTSEYKFQYDCDPTLTGDPLVDGVHIEIENTTTGLCSTDSGGTHYGELTTMQRPTETSPGLTFTFSAANDYAGYVLLATMTTPDSSTAWQYNFTTSGSNSVDTVTKPSGDTEVYTIGGDLPIEVQYYTGSSTLLATINRCIGLSGGNCGTGYAFDLLGETVTLPGPGGTNVYKTTEYNWDDYGNITSTQQWNFYTGSLPSSPSRTITNTYLSD